LTRQFIAKTQSNGPILKTLGVNMKTTFALAALACVVLFAAGCGSSSQNLIVGKWEAGEGGGKLTAEFSKDGTAKLTMLGQTMQGTYKINGDDLEWTLGGTTKKCNVKVAANELEMTSEGQTVKYKRV
jgi:hypothetical protein